MDLKTKFVSVLFSLMWIAAGIGSLGIHIAIGISVWTWLGAVIWYSTQGYEIEENEATHVFIDGDIV